MVSEVKEAPWLVLRTRSRHESAVEQSLRQKQIRAYLPKRKVVRRSRGQKRVVELPLFPGYVFVQPDPNQYENMRYIRGSCGLILCGNRPATMPENDLQAVKIIVESGAEIAVDQALIPGRRVKVISGPFAGAMGELIRVKSGERLIINAHLLSSSLSVEVDISMVELI
ncbi:MAG: UpxY family transcription antiterminator [Lysobacter sp.]|nr:MAG: UpxY family transcription antiterminator [Lysobacter sp.]